MINYDDNESNLLSFYGIKTLAPTSLNDLNLNDISIPRESSQQSAGADSQNDPQDQDYIDTNDLQMDDDKLDKLTIDEQFNLLNKLVKYDKGSNSKYQYFDDDLEDPLRGSGTNVVKDLISRQVIMSKNDPSINEYLITSREFNSQKFLTTVHKDTSMESLMKYLQFLETNIESQQLELKQVIDDNFVNFINCKDSIDEILVLFKKLKTRAQQEMEKIRIFNPQRQRNMKQDNNFLINELEESIKNLTLATSMMIRPISDNNLKEQKIFKIIEFINKNKFLFDLPSNLIKNIVNQNHDQIIEDLQNYTTHKQYLISQENYKMNLLAKSMKKESKATNEEIDTLKQEYQSINTLVVKIFTQVDRIIEEYRKSIYNQLLSFDHEIVGKPSRVNNTKFLSLVDKIDQLNGDSNKNTKDSPINMFLKTQLVKSNKDLLYQLTKFEERFSSMQKKLSDYMESLNDYREDGSYVKFIGDKYKSLQEYVNASSMTKFPKFEEKEQIVNEIFDSSDNLDLSLINETWLVFLNFVNYLYENYLKNITKFINNYNYYINNNENIDTSGEIRLEFLNLIDEISNKLFKIFTTNPMTNGSNDLMESSPKNYSNILPFYTNSLSTIFYLTRISDRINLILTSFGKNITIIGNIGKNPETNKIIKNLRNISGAINQKILEATCSVWVNDCSQFYDLETWEIDEKLFNGSDDTNDADENDSTSRNTKLINVIEIYGMYMLKKINQLVFITNVNEEDQEQPYIKIVTTYPNKKMLVSIEIQFMRCLSILVDTIMKRYNIELQKSTSQFDSFKILTMNNFDKISRKIYPNLIKYYDLKFEKNLGDQNLKLFSDIDKVNLTILDDILSKEKVVLDDSLIKFFNKLNQTRNGYKEPDGIKIDNLIYEILIHFVKLVYNIKPITNKSIFINIIHDLQNFFLKNFLDYFRKLNLTVKGIDIILVNLKLDINFFIEIFEPSNMLKLNEYNFNIAEIILNLINEKQVELGHDVINDKDFDKILIKGLRDSANQFDCLSR